MHRADHAHADAVAGAAAGEAIHRADLAELEIGAENPHPAERRADGHAKVLAGDLRGRHPVENQLADASRGVARGDAHVAQRAAHAGGGERALKIRRGKLGAPRRKAAAGIVVTRRQVGRIRRRRPDRRRDLGPAAARRAVINGRGRRAVEQHQSGRRLRCPLGILVRHAHHLAMRLVAEVEAFRPVLAHVRGRVGADRDRERFERGRRRIWRRLARQHPGDVSIKGQNGDSMGAAAQDANPDARLR